MIAGMRNAARQLSDLPERLLVTIVALVATLGWWRLVGTTLSRDEAGLLIVGSQWAPGQSLYGDYWVDRPPLLIAVFSVISLAGTDVAVRAAGAVTAAATVAIAAALAREGAPEAPRAPVAAAVAAAAAVSTPLMDAGVLNGEILALPFVLAGMWAALRAVRVLERGQLPGALGLAFAAGAAGVAAASVKQNFVDVFVFGVAVVVVSARHGPVQVRQAWLLTGAGALGAVAALAAVLGLAWSRGTPPLGLWDAVVVFRSEATGLIASAATAATPLRFAILVAALVLTGVPLVLVSVAPTLRRPTPGVDLRWPAGALLAWECLTILLGGSFWLHYLLVLVPGTVVILVAALQRQARLDRRSTTCLAVIAASAVLASGVASVRPEHKQEQGAIDYLQAHAAGGDTGLVAFGAPNILSATGLTSPYPHLWSLPVRVRDPALRELTAVLAGPRRPDWLVVRGASLASWGISARIARPYVKRYYAHRATVDGFRIYRLRDGGPGRSPTG